MGLSFITPLLLGGASLVAIPIVLHMVMRRKPVPHLFPALRFLRERAVVNRRRLRLTHLLLLALRMAAVALVALALARPVVRGAGWIGDREGPVAAAFVFDTAPRMGVREANTTRLAKAATLARTLFGKLPDASRVAVVDTGVGTAAFLPSPAAAAARIDRLAPGPQAVSLPTAIASARRLLAESPLARRELYVFTDCSHGAWDNATPQPESGTDGITPLFVDVSAESVDDCAIAALGLSADRVVAGASLAVSVTANRVGPDTTRPVAIEVLGRDGTYVRRGVKPVAWTASAPAAVEFEIAGLEPGTRQGRVIIDGADDFEADDSRCFTVEVGAATRVLVAAAPPAAQKAGLFVRAIAPQALVKSGKARFMPEAIDVGALGTASWDGAAGMVLLDPPPLPEATWEALDRWVAGGRGLVVWLGPRAGAAEGFNSSASRRVLGGDLVRVWRNREGNSLAPVALDHPILAAFRRVGDAVPWQDYPVFRHWEVRPEAVAEGAAAVPVAAYRDGLPAVLEHRLGAGTVVVVTTPVAESAADPDAWNMLATGFEPWPFVILANESLAHAIDTADDRNVTAGATAVLHLDRRDLASASVRTPAGDDFPAAVDPVRGTITVTDTRVPGNYRIRAGGEEGGVSKGFSVNLGPAELDFQRLSPDALAAVLGPGHRIARTEAELVRDVNLERIGAELFPWLILLAAIAMAADWVVANRFYAAREGVEEQQGAAVAFAEESADTAAAAVDPTSGVVPGPPAPPRPRGSPPPLPPGAGRPPPPSSPPTVPA
ncbi:MAG: BatA domain-containing protein [Planctomycetaceae bacterium]